MKKITSTPLLYFLVLALIFSCSSDDDTVVDSDDDNGMEQPEPVSALNLSDYDNGSRVMMQAFYWDVEPRFEWWNTISGKIEGWANVGVNRIWIPPASKGQSGGYSMGYDPSDYFDFGNYEQHGTIPTRFGTREELEGMISVAHDNNIEVIADIVLNHNSGGGLEYNPYRERDTYTLFDETHGNASGMFNRDYEDFYPNSVSEYDPPSLFYQETNLDHHRERVQDWLWKDENSVAKYYKNVMGFDGWRFDYVLGFEDFVIQDWLEEVGGFSVSELWDGNPEIIRNHIDATGSGAFDFAAFYTMEQAFDRNDDLTELTNDQVWQTHPEKAVTFTANHDTEKDDNEDNIIASENKLKAYAFIMTHPGYPTIFYLDYENPEFQEQLNKLISIHNSLATGSVNIIYNDNDEYIMQRNGDGNNPGLILYINTSGNAKRRTITTSWNSTILMDYSENSSYYPMADENGEVTIEAPANGYAIWSVTE
ncbi:alpha-amylase [Zunongwangia endophytica]|uniref:Alpha-amylase n=1 Tax=Zunongwangia endophytica TaxID=1808945 RepID=A0ABV8H964_9FLAO|nr:alpha-amylase [Zunongwangia endophytica]MDN3593571.1 alpha-amylase [Zunongwangia endophytica]